MTLGLVRTPHFTEAESNSGSTNSDIDLYLGELNSVGDKSAIRSALRHAELSQHINNNQARSKATL